MTPSLEVSVALANDTDFARLAPLWARDVLGGVDSTPMNETRAARQIQKHFEEGCDFWIASNSTAPLGFAYGQQIGGAYELSWVYVEPEIRNRGIGTELARAVASYAQGRGASHLSMVFAKDDRPSRALVEALCRTQTRVEIEPSQARIIF